MNFKNLNEDRQTDGRTDRQTDGGHFKCWKQISNIKEKEKLPRLMHYKKYIK